MPDETFMRGAQEGFTPADLVGLPCYVGVDFSSNRDTTAAVYCFPPQSFLDMGGAAMPKQRKDGTFDFPDLKTSKDPWRFLVRVFIPEQSLIGRVQRETAQYQAWAEGGHIILTPGITQDYEYIRQDIEEHAAKYQIKAIGYDAWNANETVQYLEKSGLPMMAYQQSFRWMSMPMMKLESLFLNNQIDHAGHPVLRWHTQCTMAMTSRDGTMIRPTKKGANTRIDAMVAMIVSVGTSIIKIAEDQNKATSEILKSGIFTIPKRKV